MLEGTIQDGKADLPAVAGALVENRWLSLQGCKAPTEFSAAGAAGVVKGLKGQRKGVSQTGREHLKNRRRKTIHKRKNMKRKGQRGKNRAKEIGRVKNA
jgi:hypothetical protein